jgi:uracil phosphoribosyltransferase
MEQALRGVLKDVKLGKILIQRDETEPSKPARLFYSKLPKELEEAKSYVDKGKASEIPNVLLLDPMLGTGSVSFFSCVCSLASFLILLILFSLQAVLALLPWRF